MCTFLPQPFFVHFVIALQHLKCCRISTLSVAVSSLLSSLSLLTFANFGFVRKCVSVLSTFGHTERHLKSPRSGQIHPLLLFTSSFHFFYCTTLLCPLSLSLGLIFSANTFSSVYLSVWVNLLWLLFPFSLRSIFCFAKKIKKNLSQLFFTPAVA